MNRLTARNPKNNMAYLVKVKPDEQDVESPYPNTLKSVLESFNRLAEYEDANEAKPIEEWHEDYGDCLFWKFPIEEPPYCGTPLDSNFTDNYYTHFTKLMVPIGKVCYVREENFCEEYCTHYTDKNYNEKTSACATCYDGSNFEDKEEADNQNGEANSCKTECSRQRGEGCKSCLFYL